MPWLPRPAAELACLLTSLVYSFIPGTLSLKLRYFITGAGPAEHLAGVPPALSSISSSHKNMNYKI